MRVTRANEQLTAVEVIEHQETEGIADQALEQMPRRIVEANSPEADAVSGATVTSNAIKEAVRNALGLQSASTPQPAPSPEPVVETLTGQAEGFGGTIQVRVTRANEQLTAVEVIEHQETEGIADQALEQMPRRIVEANSPEADAVSGATVTSNAIKEAVRNALGLQSASTPQPAPSPEPVVETLTGQARGFGGTIKVRVTRANEQLTAVEVIEHQETEGIAEQALEQMPRRIVEANSPEVDAVSGATVTSNAIKEAVRNALSATVPAAEEVGPILKDVVWDAEQKTYRVVWDANGFSPPWTLGAQYVGAEGTTQPWVAHNMGVDVPDGAFLLANQGLVPGEPFHIRVDAEAAQAKSNAMTVTVPAGGQSPLTAQAAAIPTFSGPQLHSTYQALQAYYASEPSAFSRDMYYNEHVQLDASITFDQAAFFDGTKYNLRALVIPPSGAYCYRDALTSADFAWNVLNLSRVIFEGCTWTGHVETGDYQLRLYDWDNLSHIDTIHFLVTE